MVIQPKSSFIDDMAILAIQQQPKAGDHLVLPDAVLQAALEGSRPLFRREWQAMLDSPLTLWRMQVLANLRATNTPTLLKVSHAANDPCWHGSRGLLRAADSGDAAPLLTTRDGHWRLVFPKTATGWRMVLVLDMENAPFAQSLMQDRPELAVLDGHGHILLTGPLDDDGEVTGHWDLSTPPYVHFVVHGGSFEVVRV